jgi:hypothetical protein
MAWLEGWSYRIRITISGSSGAGTGYQVLLKIGESSGATGAHFHLNGMSASFPSGKNQGGDLCFTADDGETTLSFWVENVFGSSPNRVAWVWVKVSADLGTSKTIYCYFGNPGATNLSNGSNTFLFFDDFNTLNTTIWNASNIAQTGSYVYGTASWNWLQSRDTLIPGNSNRRVRARMWLSSNSNAYVWCQWYYDSSNYILQAQTGTYCYAYSVVNNQGGGSAYGPTVTTEEWNTHDLGRAGTNYYAWVLRESTGGSGTLSFSETNSVFGNNLYIQLYSYQPSSRWDYVLIAKYVYPEPAFSSASAIQALRQPSRRLFLMSV